MQLSNKTKIRMAIAKRVRSFERPMLFWVLPKFHQIWGSRGLANWECMWRSFVGASSGLPGSFANVDRGAPKGMPVDFQKVHFA